MTRKKFKVKVPESTQWYFTIIVKKSSFTILQILSSHIAHAKHFTIINSWEYMHVHLYKMVIFMLQKRIFGGTLRRKPDICSHLNLEHLGPKICKLNSYLPKLFFRQAQGGRKVPTWIYSTDAGKPVIEN